MVRLLLGLMPGGATLLRPETIALMFQNQLPPELCVRFPGRPPFLHRGFALGSAFARRAGPGEPAEVADEVGWGGVAGTIWWLNPRLGIAAVLMTQIHFGFGNRYALSFKRQACQAMGF